jgi:hypothetical protein
VVFFPFKNCVSEAPPIFLSNKARKAERKVEKSLKWPLIFAVALVGKCLKNFRAILLRSALFSSTLKGVQEQKHHFACKAKSKDFMQTRKTTIKRYFERAKMFENPTERAKHFEVIQIHLFGEGTERLSHVSEVSS